MSDTQNNSNFANDASSTTQEGFLTWLFSGEQIFFFFIKLLIAIVVVWLFIFFSRMISKFIAKRIRLHSIVEDDDYTKKVSNLVGDIIFYTLVMFSVFVGFTILGIELGLLVWWLSFGIGFAFKDILGNMFAGLIVLTNNDYKLGDIIVIDEDKKEYFGRIEELTIRYTVLRTFDLRKVIIPNLTMVTKPIRTYDTEELVRLETRVTIHYNTPVTKAIEIIKDAVNSVKIVKERKSTKVMLEAMGDHGLEMRVFFYMHPGGQTLVPVAQSEVNQAIYASFLDKGIVIPYPHSAVTVDHNDKNLIGTMLYVKKEGEK